MIWGERLGWGERGPGALESLADLGLVLGLDAADGSGLIEVPAAVNGRGLREVGCVPGIGPGLTETDAGLTAARARDAALAGGQVNAFYLLHSDPLRELPGHELWDEALRKAAFVVAHQQFLGESALQHADVVFPAESYAEKDGTVTHPDGRLQRLRPAIGHPGEVQSEWRVLVDIGEPARPRRAAFGERRRRARSSLPRTSRSTRASRSTRSAAGECAGRSARTAPTPSASRSAISASARRRSRPHRSRPATARCGSPRGRGCGHPG